MNESGKLWEIDYLVMVPVFDRVWRIVILWICIYPLLFSFTFLYHYHMYWTNFYWNLLFFAYCQWKCKDFNLPTDEVIIQVILTFVDHDSSSVDRWEQIFWKLKYYIRFILHHPSFFLQHIFINQLCIIMLLSVLWILNRVTSYSGEY